MIEQLESAQLLESSANSVGIRSSMIPFSGMVDCGLWIVGWNSWNSPCMRAALAGVFQFAMVDGPWMTGGTLGRFVE